jgi:parallel beta-helix repeat protein
MKKIYLILTIFVIALFIVGCSDVSDEELEYELEQLSDAELEELSNLPEESGALAGNAVYNKNKIKEISPRIQYKKSKDVKSKAKEVLLKRKSLAPKEEVEPVEAVEPSVFCGDSLYESTTLEHDVTGCSTFGLKIREHDITLDCQGHSITGSSTATGKGIDVWKKSGVTIKNCQVSNFKYGIKLTESDNDVVDLNTLENNAYGLSISTAYNNVISSNTVRNSKESGIFVSGSNNEFRGNNVNGNCLVATEGRCSGILLTGSGNTLVSNIVNDNRRSGFYVYGGESSLNNVFESNTARDNWYSGFFLVDDTSGTFNSNVACGNGLNAPNSNPSSDFHCLSDRNFNGAGNNFDSVYPCRKVVNPTYTQTWPELETGYSLCE